MNILNEKTSVSKKDILTIICDQYEPNRGNIMVWDFFWDKLGRKLSNEDIEIFAEYYRNLLDSRYNFKQDYIDLLTKFRDFYSQIM